MTRGREPGAAGIPAGSVVPGGGEETGRGARRLGDRTRGPQLRWQMVSPGGSAMELAPRLEGMQTPRPLGRRAGGSACDQPGKTFAKSCVCSLLSLLPLCSRVADAGGGGGGARLPRAPLLRAGR